MRSQRICLKALTRRMTIRREESFSGSRQWQAYFNNGSGHGIPDDIRLGLPCPEAQCRDLAARGQLKHLLFIPHMLCLCRRSFNKLVSKMFLSIKFSSNCRSKIQRSPADLLKEKLKIQQNCQSDQTCDELKLKPIVLLRNLKVKLLTGSIEDVETEEHQRRTALSH
jgi:hypothetical protein